MLNRTEHSVKIFNTIGFETADKFSFSCRYILLYIYG